VLFAGKASAGAAWQVYQTTIDGGAPRALTASPDGAMDPAWLPDGRFVFCAPVPRAAQAAPASTSVALHAQPLAGGATEQLTFGLAGVAWPTVLEDGRILFVAGGSASSAQTNLSLFTVNNDGTELSAFACQHDGPAAVARPRAVEDGRVVFVSGAFAGAIAPAAEACRSRAEQVLSSRPHLSRAPLLPGIDLACRAVEGDGAGRMLVCGTNRSGKGEGTRDSFAVFELSGTNTASQALLFDDPAWNEVEAVAAVARPKPMGRPSSVDPEKRSGMILCLDARRTDAPDGRTQAGSEGGPQDRHERADGARAERVRVTARQADGTEEVLGEVALERDGSFMAEVPADRPLGFEALSEDGRVLRRVPATIWVRPGENRACVGCHEPHNRSPENRRPLAVKRPPARLAGAAPALSQHFAAP
jgi:hypothetical protein